MCFYHHLSIYAKNSLKRLNVILIEILQHNARDTRSGDKLDENSRMQNIGWKIMSCIIPYYFCRMKLNEVGWNLFRCI